MGSILNFSIRIIVHSTLVTPPSQWVDVVMLISHFLFFTKDNLKTDEHRYINPIR
jgi:hypothetical protein